LKTKKKFNFFYLISFNGLTTISNSSHP